MVKALCGLVCRKPLNRRFIVVEGVYLHSGELAPLADIYRLKEKYKCVCSPPAHLQIGGPAGAREALATARLLPLLAHSIQCPFVACFLSSRSRRHDLLMWRTLC